MLHGRPKRPYLVVNIDMNWRLPRGIKQRRIEMSLSFQRCTTCGKSSEIHESGLCMSCFSTRKRILDEAKERSVIAPVSEEPPVTSCPEMSHYREGADDFVVEHCLGQDCGKYPACQGGSPGNAGRPVEVDGKPGIFLQFGLAENGASYTVGIVKFDGIPVEVYPINTIKFLDRGDS